MQEYDKSSKYLIQRHGDSILRLAGVDDIVSWTPLQAELVQSRRLPDGLLEVRCLEQTKPDLFILEIASYPDQRVPSQVSRDTALSFLIRDIVPEVIVLFLHEKGNVPAADSVELRSRRGLTKWDLSWKAVKLWEVPAEELLAVGDVGLIPWVPLSKYPDDPERIISRCRARIDAVPESTDKANLLAVTQFLLGLRYNERPLRDKLREMLGGRKAMIESPIYQEIVEESRREGATEARRRDVLNILLVRFGPAARSLEVELNAIEFDRLEDLVKLAVSAHDLDSFRERLLS